MVLDAGKLLPADPDVLVHRALSVGLREGVPRPHLHERIDDEIWRPLRHELPRATRIGVLRGLRRREVRIGRRQPAGERRAVQRRAELTERLVALRDLPEKEIGLGTYAGRRVRAQVVETVGELLDDVGERVLRRLALLDR